MNFESSFSSLTSYSERKQSVLVLLAVRNGVQWLDEQIASVLKQASDVDVEILIGDDASTDGSAFWLANRFYDDPRFRIILREVGSGSAGANFKDLILRAEPGRYDYYALCDQDDIWCNGKLMRAIKYLNGRQDHGYSGPVKAFWPNGRERVVRQCPTTTPCDFLFEGAGQGCTFVVPGLLFAKVQAFIGAQKSLCGQLHYHDWLIYLLTRVWGGGWCFDSVPMVCYRQHESNEIGARGGFGAAAKRIKLITGGWYRNQIISAINIADAARLVSNSPLEPEIILFKGLVGENTWKARVRLSVEVLFKARRRLLDRWVLASLIFLGCF